MARADSGPSLSDADLLRSSDLVSTGHVVSVSSGRDPVTNAIYTYVTLDVTEILKGSVDEPRITIKQLGGVIGDEALVVAGQATFGVGEDVLVFLETRPRDASLYTAGLWQGKFTIDRAAGSNELIAVRAAPATRGQGVLRQEPERRTFAPMIDSLRLAVRQSGNTGRAARNTQPDALAERSPMTSVGAPFAFFATPGRWNEADSLTAIPVDVMSSGQPGVSGGGNAQLTAAMAQWSAVSNLRFSSGGNASRCFGTGSDSRISIVYGDPCGEISDSSNTLAIGGYSCLFSGGKVVNGVSFCRNTAGYIVNNNNTNTLNFFSQAATCFQGTETHELGHVFGLDHSTSTSAIMFPSISNNCRTGVLPLGSDDIAGIQFSYGAPTVSAPGTPSAFTATASGATVSLAWSAPSSGGSVSSYTIEAGSTSGSANLANFSTGNTTTSYSTGGVGSGVYFVRVKATNSAGTSGASNEATLVVGGACIAAPGAPASFAVTGNSGGTVSFGWTASSGSPTTYIIEAGSSSGLTNLANSDLGSNATSYIAKGVGKGTYFVRLRGKNSCGTGAASNEVILVVP